MSSPDAALCPRIVSRTALTSGDWEVVNRQVWWDPAHGMLYFHGLKVTYTRMHYIKGTIALFPPGLGAGAAPVLRLDPPAGGGPPPHRPRLLPLRGHVPRLPHAHHRLLLGQLPAWLPGRPPLLDQLTRVQVFAITHSDNTVDGISLSSNGWILQPAGADKDFPPPELFSHTIASGQKMYGMIYKPHNSVPGVRYPVLLNVYGGPELQLVSNSFKGLRELRSHLLASQGFVVVCIDNRGSLHRGAAWEAYLRGKLGQVELTDQVEVLHWLASVTGYLDLSRCVPGSHRQHQPSPGWASTGGPTGATSPSWAWSSTPASSRWRWRARPSPPGSSTTPATLRGTSTGPATSPTATSSDPYSTSWGR